ncbi:hypothetical protein ABMA27_004942 [Loxostege sticticalis]|uniref:Uncharacterized protein n=1 Tax=Loxostege sticticalis TaxID=481309 RepID=A0ABR3HLI2_LOXSC
MYNWRLLLLAFFAVFQPIASFAERNLVDGRQQCCDHRLQRDSTYSLYGDNRFKSENRRINDQRLKIRDVRREERRNEIRSTPEIDTFRDYRERESPESRTRLSRTELHRERAPRREVRDVTAEKRARNYRVTDIAADRIRNAEIRRDNRFRDETRIFRTRNADEDLDQRNLVRRAIDSRRETRLMRDNVDEARRTRNIRDTREELRRTRDSIIRTDRLRTLDNERNTQEESLDRRAPATRFVLRTQRSVRSLDRLSRGSDDDRRLSFDNFRKAKQESENRDVRARERNIRDTREELRRTRDSIIRTDRLRTLDNERNTQESLDRRAPATRFLLRTQRSVRSLDRLSRGSNDDRRLSFENFRKAKQESENRDVRARERDDVRVGAERRHIETPVRERSEVDREIGFRSSATRQAVVRNERSVRSTDRLSRRSNDVRVRERDEVRNDAERRNIEIRFRERPEVDREIDSRFSATRRAVLRNQRSVRSLERLSTGSHDDRRLPFDIVRISKQERESRDMRERDEVRNGVQRKNIEIRVRERSEVDREIGSRFSTTRQFVLRSQRSVRSLDRLSRGSNDDRRLSFENVRISKQERDNRESSTNSRDVRARERRDVRDETGRRNIEIRVRETLEVDREIGSRFLMSRRVDNNREQRLSANSRRNNEIRISANIGDGAYQIIRQRSNKDGHRSDRSLSRDFDSVSQFVVRSRMDAARENTDERITRQMRNIREDSRDNYRNNVRDTSLEDRRAREMTGKRLSRSETRLSENYRAHRSLNSREREINENRRTVDDRVAERMQNRRVQFLEQRENALRTLRNREEREQRDEGRASRRTIERSAIRERVSSEQRDAREFQRRNSETRNFRIRDNESRFRATSESRRSIRIIEKENAYSREDSDARRDTIRNVIALKTKERQNIDSRMKSNVDFSRNNVNTFNHKRVENENGAYENNWQNLIYTMQGIYLCSILIPMFMNNNSDKKKAKSLGLWTHFQKLVKTD